MRLRFLRRKVIVHDAKCNHDCPYKREAEEDFTQKRKRCCDPGDRDFGDVATS